jgi:putative two-component system response regulator
VATYARLLAQKLGLGPEQLEIVRQAALMHDIGKIGVPDRILNKAGALEPEELALMRSHAAYGAAVLRGAGSPALAMARAIALCHHER